MSRGTGLGAFTGRTEMDGKISRVELENGIYDANDYSGGIICLKAKKSMVGDEDYTKGLRASVGWLLRGRERLN